MGTMHSTHLKMNGLYVFQYPTPHTKRQVLPNIKVMKYCIALPNIYGQFFILSKIKITHPDGTKYNFPPSNFCLLGH